MITLKITRKEKNPDYVQARTAQQIFRQDLTVDEFSIFDVLEVEITNDQFEAIRKAVLEKF